MAQTVKIDGLADAIEEALSDFGDSVAEGVKEATVEVARECLREIRQKSPRKTGDYAKGWRSKKLEESEDSVHIVIYNKTKPWLVHLLENGHPVKNKDGKILGVASPKPHVRPAELNAEKKLMKKVKVVISGGKA